MYICVRGCALRWYLLQEIWSVAEDVARRFLSLALPSSQQAIVCLILSLLGLGQVQSLNFPKAPHYILHLCSK